MQRMKTSIKSALILLILFVPYPVPSGPMGSNEFIHRQKRVIKSLFQDKRYFDCIAETRRLLTYTPAGSLSDEYRYFIEANYFLGGQYKTVISNIKESGNDDTLVPPYLLLLSRSYMKLGLDNESLNTLSQYDYDIMKKNEREELFLLRIEAYLRNSLYREALSETHRFKKLQSDFPLLPEMEKGIEGYKEIGLKSKELSLLLSAVIPGSGQIYAGRIADGLISLAAILACSSGAYYFHRRGNTEISYTLIFFSVLFYGGNIYGAYNTTESFNRAVDEEFKKKLIGKYIPPYDPMRYIDSGRILK
jgi:hypothetical protein